MTDPTGNSATSTTPRAPETSHPQSAGSRGMRLLLRGVLLLIAAAVFVGTAVHFTIRDQTPSSALIFYGTPLPVLILGGLCCLIGSVWSRRWRTGCRWIVFLILLTGIWLRSAWRFPGRFDAGSLPDTAALTAEDTDSSEDLSVLFWNVARRANLDAAARFIRQQDPDLVGLVEVQGDPETWRQFWKKELPGHNVSVLGANIYLLTKGSSGEAIPHNLGGGSQARQLEVRLHHRLYEILLVDIHANPFQPRKQALDRLTQLADQLSDRRLIIMGDFNLPTDSVHLKSLRKRHLLAFEAAGRGYSATWPIPLPLMQLDQIWTNFQVIPVECRHSWTWASDHEPVGAIIRPRRSVPNGPGTSTPESSAPGEQTSVRYRSTDPARQNSSPGGLLSHSSLFPLSDRGKRM